MIKSIKKIQKELYFNDKNIKNNSKRALFLMIKHQNKALFVCIL